MQRILLKILTELERSSHSETLARFRHYQGTQLSMAHADATLDSTDNAIPVLSQAGSLLGISLPSVSDQLNAIDANEVEEEISTNLQQLSVVHCSPTKYKKANNTSSSASSASSTSAIPTVNTTNISAAESYGPNHRKITVAIVPM